MKKYIEINNKKIYYQDRGQGKPIVLLHGYLEALDIWNDFSLELAQTNRVISIDIPGHGKSEIISDVQSIQSIAEILNSFLNKLKIDSCFLIGHSMGGYITLMFHELFADKLAGFCLFHSHPFADSEETKKKRLREIELVKDGKKDLIAKFNIPNAFASSNITRLKKEISEATYIALKTSEEGIITNLYAMMNRPDLSESLSNTNLPFLLIAGKEDNYIDVSTVIPKIKLPKNSSLYILENSGHIGFIEEKEKSVQIINQFFKTIE